MSQETNRLKMTLIPLKIINIKFLKTAKQKVQSKLSNSILYDLWKDKPFLTVPVDNNKIFFF